MGKILVIAEKPSVARDYARVLGVRGRGEGYMENDQYIVSWAVGHLVGLKQPEEYDANFKYWRRNTLPIVPQKFELTVLPGQTKQFRVLKKLMNSKEVDRIICGTDSGREGELIFRYIYEMAGCKKPFDRLWVSSMTEEAISAGFKALKNGHDYDNLYASAKCRSEADWLVGINGSRAFTVGYGVLLSIGRVQTPTLSMIVRRQKEIDSFVPQDYLEVRLTHPDFQSKYFTLEEGKKQTRVQDEEAANLILEHANQAGIAKVEKVSKTPKKEFPPLLYDLTELQRDGNRKFGYSANKVLSLAQSLYEKHKLLTYPRTDSRYLPEDMMAQVPKVLHAINLPIFHDALMHIPVREGGKLPFNKRIIDNSKITDHHAIIPTPRKPDVSSLTKDEWNVYQLVCKRLIEVFYPPYQYLAVEAVLSIPTGESFYATGREVQELGFMALRKQDEEAKAEAKKKRSKASEAQDSSKELPPLVEGQQVAITKAQIDRKKTEPPKPFTEATLLTAMESAGKWVEEEELKDEMKGLSLGTPATRASIIERLIKVGYIVRKGKILVPTEKGKKLMEVLPIELKSPEMTGKWERALERIKDGTMDPTRFMGSIQRYVAYIVASSDDHKPVVFEKEPYKSKKRSSGKTGQNQPSSQGQNPQAT